MNINIYLLLLYIFKKKTTSFVIITSDVCNTRYIRRGFAKKTLLKTARKAGLKPKPSKRQKYVLPSADARSLTSPPLMSSLSADTLSCKYNVICKCYNVVRIIWKFRPKIGNFFHEPANIFIFISDYF